MAHFNMVTESSSSSRSCLPFSWSPFLTGHCWGIPFFCLSASSSVTLPWHAQKPWFHRYACCSSGISHACPQYCLSRHTRSDIHSLELCFSLKVLTQEVWSMASGTLKVLFPSTHLHQSFMFLVWRWNSSTGWKGVCYTRTAFCLNTCTRLKSLPFLHGLLLL